MRKGEAVATGQRARQHLGLFASKGERISLDGLATGQTSSRVKRLVESADFPAGLMGKILSIVFVKELESFTNKPFDVFSLSLPGAQKRSVTKPGTGIFFGRARTPITGSECLFEAFDLLTGPGVELSWSPS